MKDDYSDAGDEEENVYKKGTREDLVDNDELSPQEEAFMEGYDEDSGEEEEAAAKKKKAEEEESE